LAQPCPNCGLDANRPGLSPIVDRLEKKIGFFYYRCKSCKYRGLVYYTLPNYRRWRWRILAIVLIAVFAALAHRARPHLSEVLEPNEALMQEEPTEE
jgi:hypothetical protein